MAAAKHAEWIRDWLAPKRLGPARLVWDGMLMGFGLSIAFAAVLRGQDVGKVLLGCGVASIFAADALTVKDGVIAMVVRNLGLMCLFANFVSTEPRDSAQFITSATLLFAMCLFTPLMVWRFQRLRRSVPPLGPPIARA